MKLDDIEARLKLWADRCESVDGLYEAMSDLVGVNPDGQLATQLFGTLEDYTAAVSEIVGDRSHWLGWYRYECAMGKTPKGMRFPGDKKDRIVKTLRDLARVILMDGAGVP